MLFISIPFCSLNVLLLIVVLARHIYWAFGKYQCFASLTKYIRQVHKLLFLMHILTLPAYIDLEIQKCNVFCNSWMFIILKSSVSKQSSYLRYCMIEYHQLTWRSMFSHPCRLLTPIRKVDLYFQSPRNPWVVAIHLFD